MSRPTVYSRSNCRQCKLTKDLMTREGIKFREIDVEEDPDSLAYIKGLGYLSAPVVVWGAEHWSGFRPDLILGARDGEA